MPKYTMMSVLAALALGGCGAAWDVATLPVKATSKAVDWTTTSRDEADRNAERERHKAHHREDGTCHDCDRYRDHSGGDR